MKTPARTFQEIVANDFEKLDVFTKAITRAHGQSHPEAFQVRERFEAIRAKVRAAGAARPDLDAEFAELRRVTGHYAVPADTCETYAAVYRLLAEADRAYHAPIKSERSDAPCGKP